MNAIKPGDVCQIIDPRGSFSEIERPFIGLTVTALHLDPRRRLRSWRVAGVPSRVLPPNTTLVFVVEDCLRKIEPPDDSRDVRDWGECPWQPAEVIA